MADAQRVDEHVELELTVNGQRYDYVGPPMKRLLDVLREDLALTGTKEGCGEGECGACTVIVAGCAVNSCLIPVGQVCEEVTTIDGVAANSTDIQRLLVELGGTQCGICTPGIVMTALSVRRRGPRTRHDWREYLAGNLCRCTGYQKIIDAVERMEPIE